MLNRSTATLITCCLCLLIACTDDSETPAGPESVATPPATPTTQQGAAGDLAELVKNFVAAIDRQEAILKQYSKDDSTLKAGDGAPLWQASLEGEQALSRIADMAKAHPEWKATIVQWWHAEIEPAHVRHFRAGRHTLKSELLKHAAPDAEQLRSMLLRELSAGVALDRLAKEVKAGA